MHVVAVTIKVKPGEANAARFEEAILRNHEKTRQEPGNIRFDVLKAPVPEDPEMPTEYMLYEVYHSKADFTAHQQTEHYLAFKEAAADLMAEPRIGKHFRSLAPDPWS